MEKKLTETELKRKLATASRQVKIKATYTHYKNKQYLVLDLAILEASNEVGVIYKALYGENLTFIRPLSSWLKMVEWQGASMPRFTLNE